MENYLGAANPSIPGRSYCLKQIFLIFIPILC
jgi:hypothetical protein